jgi:hypothetical protein
MEVWRLYIDPQYLSDDRVSSFDTIGAAEAWIGERKVA